MTATRRHRSFRLAALLAALLLPAGCGLSDYEAKMGSEKARVDRWDEEAKALGEPIKMPELPKKDGKEQAEWKVFLRLPRGVSEAANTEPNSTQARLVGPLAQYAGGGNSGFQNVYLGVAYDVKDYAGMAYGALNVPPGGELVVNVERSPALLAAVATGKAAPPAEIKYRRKTAEAVPPGATQSSSFSFNFYESGKWQVVIVFQAEKGTSQRADLAIKLSLGTFGFGEDELRQLRDAYYKTNRKGGKK